MYFRYPSLRLLDAICCWGLDEASSTKTQSSVVYILCSFIYSFATHSQCGTKLIARHDHWSSTIGCVVCGIISVIAWARVQTLLGQKIYLSLLWTHTHTWCHGAAIILERIDIINDVRFVYWFSKRAGKIHVNLRYRAPLMLLLHVCLCVRVCRQQTHQW